MKTNWDDEFHDGCEQARADQEDGSVTDLTDKAERFQWGYKAAERQAQMIRNVKSGRDG